MKSWLDDCRSIRYWLLLGGLPLGLAMLMVLAMPFSVPMPDYYNEAMEFVRTGHIAQVNFPMEYSWLCGLSYRAAGHAGFVLLQVAVYISTAIGVWAIARQIGAGCRHALAGGLLAALYPQLLVSVTKLWDLDFTVLLMVALMLGIVSLLRGGIRVWLVIVTGIAFGACMAQRPNMLLMLPLLAYVLLAARLNWGRKLLALVVGGAVSAATLIAINTLAHGSFFLPQNGPYNLVQGHNEYSIRVMLDDLSCEPSVAMLMKADGLDASHFDDADPTLQHYFSHRAFAYMQSHPLQEVTLTAVKLWTFLRPNTRLHRGWSLWTVPLVLMAMVIPVWLGLIYLKMPRGLDRYDQVFLYASVLFVLPFLLTASDPRYQVPLDIVLFAPIVSLIEQRGSVVG